MLLRIMLVVLALLGTAGYVLADDEEGSILRRVENKLVIQGEEPPPEPEYTPPPRPAPKKPAKPSRIPAPPPVRHEEPPAPVVAGADDEHYIQPDDYFVQKHGLDNRAWIWVKLAKLVTPPSSASKNEGEFMDVKNGQNHWSSHYWRTRIADKSELRLGMHAIMFNDNNRDGVYSAPRAKDKARGGSWFYAKITDMSDLYKGYVTVSGNYKVSLKNIRVILH